MSAHVPAPGPDVPLEPPCGQLANVLGVWLVGFCLIERTEFVSLEQMLASGPTSDSNALAVALRELSRVGRVRLDRTNAGFFNSRKGTMKKILIVALLLCAGTVRGQIPVTVTSDIPAWMNQVETMAEWGKTAKSWAEQAKAWVKQYQQMQEQYSAITGVRNLGNVLNNKILRRDMPEDWSIVYDSAGDAMLMGAQAAKVADMRGLSAKIKASEQLTGTVDADLARVTQRASDMAASNKAVGQSAYSKQPALLGQIESLMSKINETQDAKAIAELQARIGAEQAAQAWQTNNVLLVGQMQQTERDLAREQRQALAGKILDSKNTSMPGF